VRWWQGAVGYEIYVRSFADSDGDGTGDLRGIRDRLAYLADLGVDIVWITPFYPSPQADHGYDVADYLGVDPTYGTVDDAIDLIDRAHELGMRAVFDLVPNHTSSEHPWFLDACSSRGSAHRDWYVWRDPAPDGGPPNNWVSYFGGPAWTLDEATGQYYLHLFLPEQPDLNWANDEVRAAFVDILDTWFARGADGVRIDVAHALVIDEEHRDNPVIVDLHAEMTPEERFEAFEHRHDLDQDGVLDVYREWNEVAAKHDALLLGEVYLLETDRLQRFVADRDGLHLAFAFAALHTDWDVEDIRGRSSSWSRPPGTTSPGRSGATTTHGRRRASAAARSAPSGHAPTSPCCAACRGCRSSTRATSSASTTATSRTMPHRTRSPSATRAPRAAIRSGRRCCGAQVPASVSPPARRGCPSGTTVARRTPWRSRPAWRGRRWSASGPCSLHVARRPRSGTAAAGPG
jgi:alpha-glucosidase